MDRGQRTKTRLPPQVPPADVRLHRSRCVWHEITNVADELDGPDRKDYAVRWLGSQPGRVSPLSYVNASTPPVITTHGDTDDLVACSWQPGSRQR